MSEAYLYKKRYFQITFIDSRLHLMFETHREAKRHIDSHPGEFIPRIERIVVRF